MCYHYRKVTFWCSPNLVLYSGFPLTEVPLYYIHYAIVQWSLSNLDTIGTV